MTDGLPIDDRVTRTEARRGRTSSFCNLGGCVEVELVDDAILVRSTVLPRRMVPFSLEEWRAFVLGVKNSEFDLEALARPTTRTIQMPCGDLT